MDTYSHVLPSMHGETAAAMDALLERRPEGIPLVSLAGGQGDAEPGARESAAEFAKTETSD